jgi:hypothetical protein
MTPLERYQADLKRPEFFHDAAQETPCVICSACTTTWSPPSRTSRACSANCLARRIDPVKGLYFWGGVGRGKTYLVDTFFDALPFKQKMRTHFHRFMKRVHEEMKTLKGEKNPLTIIGKRFADEARVICFDEFFVSDITDAMILATLLEELFKNGVTWWRPRTSCRTACTRTVCSAPLPAGHCAAQAEHRGGQRRQRCRLPSACPGAGRAVSLAAHEHAEQAWPAISTN